MEPQNSKGGEATAAKEKCVKIEGLISPRKEELKRADFKGRCIHFSLDSEKAKHFKLQSRVSKGAED